MIKLRRVLSVGVAAATLAVVLTYVLAGPVLLQTTPAEEGHNMFMSLTREIAGLLSMHGPQMHSGPASSESQMDTAQSMKSMRHAIIENNVLGGPSTLPAGGLAAVVVMGTTILSILAFVISWNQKSFVVTGLLVASGIILMLPPLANMNFVIPGPIIGVIAALVILGLGVAKGIQTARMTAAAIDSMETHDGHAQ